MCKNTWYIQLVMTGLYTAQIVSQTDPIRICRLSCLRIYSFSRFNAGNLQDSKKIRTLIVPLQILTHSALINKSTLRKPCSLLSAK